MERENELHSNERQYVITMGWGMEFVVPPVALCIPGTGCITNME